MILLQIYLYGSSFFLTAQRELKTADQVFCIL